MRAGLAKLTVVALCVLSCAAVTAQQKQELSPGSPPPAMQARGPFEGPQSGPEQRKLLFFLGQWEETVRYPNAPEAKGEEGSGKWVARPALGLYVHINYQGNGPLGKYRAFGILGYDRDTQSYRLWWFDDSGNIGDYRGNFADENTLRMEHHGKIEGRDFRERITYTRISPTQVRTRIEQATEREEYKVTMDALANRTGDLPLAPPARPGDRP